MPETDKELPPQQGINIERLKEITADALKSGQEQPSQLVFVWGQLEIHARKAEGDDNSVMKFIDKLKGNGYSNYEGAYNQPFIRKPDGTKTQEYSPAHADLMQTIGALTRSHLGDYSYTETPDKAPEWYKELHVSSKSQDEEGKSINQLDDLFRELTSQKAIHLFRAASQN